VSELNEKPDTMKKHSKQFLASLRASRVENELNKVRNDRFIADRL
jgi:hypothetical protein